MNKMVDGIEYVVETIEGKGQCLVPKQSPLKVGNKLFAGHYEYVVISHSSNKNTGPFAIMVLSEGTGQYCTVVGGIKNNLEDLTIFAKQNLFRFTK